MALTPEPTAAAAMSAPESPPAPETTGVVVADAEWVAPSWDELVRTHSARVHRLAYRLTGNAHDAEDLTQDVFVRVFRSLSSYSPGTFEGWLHRITTNLFLDTMRRKARIRFEMLSDDASERIAGREPSPAQAYDDTHWDDDVQRALDALAPEFRAAVVLCDIEGLSYEEIRRDTRHQARYRSQPDSPRSVAAAHGACAPCALDRHPVAGGSSRRECRHMTGLGGSSRGSHLGDIVTA